MISSSVIRMCLNPTQKIKQYKSFYSLYMKVTLSHQRIIAKALSMRKTVQNLSDHEKEK